jgi:hypothetical protein
MYWYEGINKWLLGLAVGSLTLVLGCMALQSGAQYDAQVVLFLGPFALASFGAAFAAVIGAFCMLFVPGWYGNSRRRFWAIIAFSLTTILVLVSQLQL